MTTTTEGFRSIGTVHDVDDRRHSVIVEFPHETLDSYRTDFGRDCFRDSFHRQLPVMLREHDRHSLVGHATKAEVLPHANRIVGQFSSFEDVPLARQTFAQIRDGDLPGWSFHFRNGRATRHPNVRSAVRYTKADMPEFSAVTMPSIPGTKTVDIRAAAPGSAVDRFQHLSERWELLAQLDELAARCDRDLARRRGELPSPRLPAHIARRCIESGFRHDIAVGDSFEAARDAIERAARRTAAL